MIPVTVEQWLVYLGLIAAGWFLRHNGVLSQDPVVPLPPPPPFLTGHPLAAEFYQFLADRFRQSGSTAVKQ